MSPGYLNGAREYAGAADDQPAPPHRSTALSQAAKRLSLSAGHSSSLPALAKDAPIFSPQKLSLPKSRRHTQSLRV